MDHCDLTLSNFMVNSIGLKRVNVNFMILTEGEQWLSGRVLVDDSRPRGGGFQPHLHHCVVSLKTH